LKFLTLDNTSDAQLFQYVAKMPIFTESAPSCDAVVELLHTDIKFLAVNPDYIAVVLLESDSGSLLPVILLDTEDRGKILTLPFEIIPCWCEEIMDSGVLADFGLLTLEKGRPDYIVQLKDNFDAHIKRLRRISKCWDRRGKNELVITVHAEGLPKSRHLEVKHLCQVTYDYFTEGRIQNVFKDHFNGLLATDPSYLSPVITVEHDGVYLGCGYFKKDDLRKEVYWLNSHTERSGYAREAGVGNVILFTALLLCYQWGYDLNLGLGLFDYKKLWTDHLEYRRGILPIRQELIDLIWEGV
jgi:hypothetical protein